MNNPYLKQFEIYISPIELELRNALKKNYLPPFMMILFHLDIAPVISKVEDPDKIADHIIESNADAVALIARSFYKPPDTEKIPCIIISYKDKTRHQFTRVYPVTINEDDMEMSSKCVQVKDENNPILKKLFPRLH